MTHNCTHEKDWEDYKKLKEEIIGFIKSKNIMNGITKETIMELKEEIDHLNNKIDKLLFIFITAFLTTIITLLLRTLVLR